jgi:C4-dicarboxylate transporter DctM subunit
MVSTIIFSAISGSSVATAVAIGRVMIPKLIEAGYNRQFAVGLIAAGGGLGILIPPSVPLIIYATVAEISVADVFMAAMGPGLILGGVFCLFVIAVGNRVRDPNVSIVSPTMDHRTRVLTIARALPVIVLPFFILGGIFWGYFTPGQAAAVAVVYATILSLTFYRRADGEPLYHMVADAGRLASTILLIMAATSVFGYIITQNRIPFHFAQYIDDLGLSPFLFLLFVNVFLLALGCLLEIISVILITLPIFLPILGYLDINPVHFAIIMVVNMELAVITPPIGMNLFVISSISGVPILRVFRGTLSFAALMMLMLLLVTYSETLSLFSLRLFSD